MRIRHEAKKAYVHMDSSRRVQEALTRRAVAQKDEFRVGDLVTYQRNHDKDGAKETRQWKRWSPAARIIGFEGRSRKKKLWESFNFVRN